jgi:acylphosphatase
MTTCEIIARGRVQGVGFRWFVQRTALELGICGEVRNLSDGSVIILAQAEEHLLNSFQAYIQKGTSFIRVDSMEVAKMEIAKKYNDFEIK